MNLSEFERLESFALLGPGFTGDGWMLQTDLSDCAEAPTLVFAAYEPEQSVRALRARTSRRVTPTFPPDGPSLVPELDASGHEEAVATIRDAIACGDVYQVNLTLRASLGDTTGSAILTAFCRSTLPRFAAWVRLPDGTEFVSASPELFFATSGRAVRVEPMKGTAQPNARDALAASDKDRSELAMITDLMRNDLVPLCEPRSVVVVDARRFIELPYAVQTVSDVQGRLRPGLAPLDVLRALHPGGSVTGAPKKAAMRFISQLEPTPRGAYCGALGLVSGDESIFSLLIRTAQRGSQGWVYGVGGGIVWDSCAQAELAEVHVKLGAMR